MKKIKKEIIAVLSGMVFAYMWQMLFLFICYTSNPDGNFITADMFVPARTIQLAIVPMVAWVMMGILRVSWFKQWLRITMILLAFTIPLMLIAGFTVIVAPALWRKPTYWAINIVISFALMFTAFKPLLKVKYSDVEENLSEVKKEE